MDTGKVVALWLAAGVLAVSAGAAEAATLLLPVASGHLFDNTTTPLVQPDTITPSSTPSIGTTATSQTVGIVEFDVSAIPFATITSATFSFDVTPTAADSAVLVATYAGDGVLASDDWGHIFDDPGFFESGSGPGTGYDVTTHFDLDATFFISSAASGNFPGFHFFSANLDLPDSQTISNLSLKIEVVPEPSALLLAVCGLTALLFCAWRRRVH